MRRKKYSCPNGCALPPRRKVLQKYENGTYGFNYKDFNFCPLCGILMPYALNKLKRFFDVYNIHPDLADALTLMYKAEFESAARESFVTVENYLKRKSGLDLHGFDLAAKALSFETDKITGDLESQCLLTVKSRLFLAKLKRELHILSSLNGYISHLHHDRPNGEVAIELGR